MQKTRIVLDEIKGSAQGSRTIIDSDLENVRKLGLRTLCGVLYRKPCKLISGVAVVFILTSSTTGWILFLGVPKAQSTNFNGSMVLVTASQENWIHF